MRTWVSVKGGVTIGEDEPKTKIQLVQRQSKKEAIGPRATVV